jgi:cellulose biosynthesis protein BcsQ
VHKPKGRIVTFYSYIGGAGRTMSLVNVAWVMASAGMRVLMVDWHLEAPGLNRYVRPFLRDPDLTSTSGLLEMLTDFIVEAMTPSEDAPADWYLASADVKKYTTEIEWSFPSSGTLNLLPAGKQGASYAQTMSHFDWSLFYTRFGGGRFLEIIKERMRAEYDYVLIDSRTGVSDTAGICTVQMPDDLVVCVRMNSQAIEGAATVASSAAGQRRGSPTPLRIFPVPTRVESVELELHQRAFELAKKKFRDLTPHIQDESAYWRDVSVPYIPGLAFSEIPAAFAEGHASAKLLEPAERLISYLMDGKVCDYVPVPEDRRISVRHRYQEGGSVGIAGGWGGADWLDG